MPERPECQVCTWVSSFTGPSCPMRSVRALWVRSTTHAMRVPCSRVESVAACCQTRKFWVRSACTPLRLGVVWRRCNGPGRRRRLGSLARSIEAQADEADEDEAHPEQPGRGHRLPEKEHPGAGNQHEA